MNSSDESSGSLPDLSAPDLGDGSPSEAAFRLLMKEVAAAPPVGLRALLAWTSPDSLVGSDVGHFRVERVIGKGGLGVVYLARDLAIDRHVALKILAPPKGGGATSHARVLHEASVAAKVNDPSVAAIYEAGDADGISFIAMEYVDGDTLRATLARGPLAWPRVTELGLELAAGLAKAHDLGIVHRDLKPENIMIAKSGKLKILDFGIAGQPGEVSSGSGTPLYMDPTESDALESDARVDVYALGVLLLECGVGERAARELLLGGDRPRDLRRVRSALDAVKCPRRLAAAIVGCLSSDRAMRPSDGAVVASMLASISRSRVTRRQRLVAVAFLGATFLAALSGAGMDALRQHRANVARGPSLTVPTPELRLRRLTANVPEQPILGMDLSPDARSLAYADRTGLHVMRVGTADNHLVPFEPGAVPQLVRWFRDGTRLAVVVATRVKPSELRVVDMVTGEQTRVARGDFSSIAVAPDGKSIAFAETNMVGIALTEPGSKKREIVRKAAQDYIGEVTFSPNGMRVAYVSFSIDSISRPAIETVSFGGGMTTTVMRDARLVNDVSRSGLAWLPTGDILVALSEWLPAESGTNLWRVTLDESTGEAKGPPRQVTQWQGLTSLLLSPDATGKNVAFVRYDVQTDIFLGDLNADHELVSAPVRFTLTERNERRPTWARDSRGMFYSSDQSGNYDIFYQDLSGAPPFAVAASRAWETSPVVDPEGARLLYWRLPAVTPDEEAVMELVSQSLAPDAGSLTLMTEKTVGAAGTGRPPPWDVRVRCAGTPRRGCVLSTAHGKTITFNRIDSVSGVGEEVYREDHAAFGSGIWDLSPDGELLALPTPLGPIRLLPISRAHRGARDIPMPEGCDPFLLSWAPDQTGLFVTCEFNADEDSFRLFFVPLEGHSHLVWQYPPNYLLESEPSPDGKHLAVAVKRPDDDVWLATGLPGN